MVERSGAFLEGIVGEDSAEICLKGEWALRWMGKLRENGAVDPIWSFLRILSQGFFNE